MATFYSPVGYGAPLSGDVAYFYEGDTTTPAVVYSDADLSDELGTSVTADSNGGWPPIFLDPEVLYKVKFIRSGGSVSSPLQSYYPINTPLTVADGSITAAKLAEDAALDNLGYTPVDRAGDQMEGELLLDATFTTRNPLAAGLTGAGANNEQNGAYTFVLLDTRRVTKKTSTATPTWTIPPQGTVAFAENDVLVIENNGASGSITIARGVGVVLYTNGALVDADKALAAGTSAVLKNVATNTWRLI